MTGDKRSVGNYVIAQPQWVGRISSNELVEQTWIGAVGTSDSTVVQLWPATGGYGPGKSNELGKEKKTGAERRRIHTHPDPKPSS